MGISRTGWAWAGWVLLMPLAASAGGEKSWETLLNGPLTVRTRELPDNNAIKEVWAVGTMEAEVQDIQSAIMDAEAYPRFMPYFKESRYLTAAQDSGTRMVYSRMALPFVNERDYVVRVTLIQSVKEDGSGEFINRWEAVHGQVPARNNVVRLKFNTGTWEVRPMPNGKSQVTYRVACDPGSWVPGFALDAANKRGVPETFKAVETEAKHRAAKRKQQASLVTVPVNVPSL